MTIEWTILIAAGLVSVTVIVATGLMMRLRAAEGPAAETDALSSRLSDLESALAGRDGALRESVGMLDARLGEMKADLVSREAALGEQIGGLNTRMTGISALFSNDRARGGWGEITLRRILELGGLAEGRDFTEQAKEGDSKPDVIVHLPGGSRITVDAKFPIARYQEALTESDSDRRSHLLAEQGRELSRVGAGLAKKNYADLTTGGYVVMYLPSQAVYELVCEASSGVVESLMGDRVVIAGPTSLFTLISTAGALLTQYRALQDAESTLADVRELNKRLATWIGHIDKMGQSLTGAVKAYNGAVGSWSSRVQPQLTRIADSAGNGETPGLASVDEALRPRPENGLRAVI